MNVNAALKYNIYGLIFKCRTSKKATKNFSTWLFNNIINVQLNQNGKIHKIFHTEDLETLLKIDEIDFFQRNL